MELVPRAPQEFVEANDEAKQRRHMRSLPHRGEKRPPVETVEVPASLHDVQEDPVPEVPVMPGEDARAKRRRERAEQKELRLQSAASAVSATSSNDMNN